MGGGTRMVSPNDSRTSLGRKDKEFCEGTKQERQIRRTLHLSLDRAEAVIDGMTGFAFVVLGVGSNPAPLKAKGAAPGVENVRSRHCPSPSQPVRCGSAEEKAGCFG